MIGVGPARLLVAFALIAGLFGMHGMVFAEADRAAGTPNGVSAAAPGQHVMPMTDAHSRAPSAEGAADPTTDRSEATAPGDIPHPADHQMLHLCLAVLAGLLLVAAALGPAWWPGDRRSATRGRYRGGRREPPQRPPPTSVRLAQLCVMRN